jgi:hypothetical protein
MKTLVFLLFPLLLHASSQDRAQKFFVDHYEAAEQLYFCDGIPIALSLGVWALESKYGSSKAAQRNNLAGIASYKGGKHWKRFETKAEFYRAFAAIFHRPCYRNDLRPKSVDEYLKAMEWGCCSYHRSREYTHKIKWIIKRYKLDKMGSDEFKESTIIYLKSKTYLTLTSYSVFYGYACEWLNLNANCTTDKENDKNIRKIKKLIKELVKDGIIYSYRARASNYAIYTHEARSCNYYELTE